MPSKIPVIAQDSPWRKKGPFEHTTSTPARLFYALMEILMRNKITVRQKRWLLSAHLLCTVAWLGAALCSLIFNLTALFVNDPHLLNAAYIFADILDKAILRGGAIGALITGVLLSVLTQWGLLRFYWIIVKEIASILCIVVGVVISGWNDNAIALTAVQGLRALHNPLYLTNQTLMFIGIFFQLIALSGVIVISVFKPWGQRKRPVYKL
jgi:hypothetical protein